MKVPQHIAFIMDGNRRWARKNKLKIIMGHNKGVDRVEELVDYAHKKGVKFMTFWAFSTENWKRAKTEVDDLMTVFRNMINGEMIQRMMDNGVRVRTIGDISAFPKDIYERLLEIESMSAKNEKIDVIFGLNYGGRFEILRAVNVILNEMKNPKKSQDSSSGKARSQNDKGRVVLNEKTFPNYLFTKDFPDPDLIVRTGGEQRLSGFLPWQSTYSELYFTQVLWPEFDKKEFQKALDEYSDRERRFGK